MDKFDDFLEKQSKSENEKFTLPKSFDNKIEETLLNLDKESKKDNHKWYLNKKVWTTAACFAFICLAGVGLTYQSKLENIMSRSNMQSGQEFAMESAVEENNVSKIISDDSSPEVYGLSETGMYEDIENNDLSNEDNIYSINIEVINSSPKYKKIINKEDISIITNFINSIPLYETINEDIKDWMYSVKVYGEIDHVYKFEDNLVSIDGIVYKTSKDKIDELNKLYDILKYEENSIN